MRPIRIFALILTVIILFSCTACFAFIPINYSCDIDTVESIQIIELGQRDDSEQWAVQTDEDAYTVLVEVEDDIIFAKRLNELIMDPLHLILGDPPMLFKGYIVIRVNYKNGDYDLVKDGLQVLCRSGEYDYQYGQFISWQYEALLSDYLPES